MIREERCIELLENIMSFNDSIIESLSSIKGIIEPIMNEEEDLL